MGVVFALYQFPDAAFARNPVGQFGWHLVGFASAIGIPLAVSQWVILSYIPKYRKSANVSYLILWIPITSIGIILTILPLWFWDASAFAAMPLLVMAPILPGAIFLGFGQWFVLHQVIMAKITWVARTIIGIAIGATVGLLAAFITPFPMELTWAFVTGVGIGIFQGGGLTSELDTDLKRQEN
ncbi:hypothetical protein N9H39_08810 [Gammaproteobacteria bacterium]|nr:hypothetical protein [Gammaproteobacteria bacterium]